MTRIAVWSFALTACFLSDLAAAPAPKEGEKIVLVELKDHFNSKLDQNLHTDNYDNNTLKSLPKGRQKFGEIPFFIGDGALQLGSAQVEKKPEKIEGIKIGSKFKKLHLLHATGYSGMPEQVVGKYVVKYEDNTSDEIPMIYGVDVVDWWSYPDQKAPTKGKAVWEGENEASKGFDAKIKLYAKTWENPKPDKKVVAIDFVSNAFKESVAPFCLAITYEK
jgi:hypothetical protein